MLFLNEKEAKPLAIIKGGKYNKDIVSISTELDDGMKDINLDKVGGIFQPIQDPKIERGVHYVTGPSGSGKSYWIGNFIEEMQKSKKWKKIPVYLLSPFKEDKSLDKINPLRLKCDDIDTNPIDWKEFDKGSIIIFDDVDCFPPKIKEQLYILIDALLKGGRHYNQTLFITMHNPTGRQLQTILNEAHDITYFPRSGSKIKLLYMVENYAGLTKEDYDKIKRTKSRWATIYKNYPMAIVTDKQIFTPQEDSEDDLN